MADEIVVSIHGVESDLRWLHTITPSFGGIEGLVYYPHVYGKFRFWKILIARLRNREINRFYTKLSELQDEHPNIRPSVIAHSFGTYVVCRTLVIHPEIKLNRLVLCGSIVQCDYGWKTLLDPDSGRVRRVRNDVAGLDPVVRLFRFRLMRMLVPHTGPSGIDTFGQAVRGLEEEPFPEFHHCSQFIAKSHCRSFWMPFIRGTREFMDLCRKCADATDPEQESARREFSAAHHPAIEQAVEAAFRDSSSAQRAAYAKLIRKNIIDEGGTGQRRFHELLERSIRAMMKHVRE